MMPRDLHPTGPGPTPPPERAHPLPGTDWHVCWERVTETYRITGPGAPDHGFLPSIEDLAAALAPAPAPLPEHVRAGLQSDRALHPPIPDAWRRRVDTVTAVLAPCGAGVVQVSPHILGPEADQQVYVHAWAEVAPAVRGLLRDAGYRLRVYENMPQACLVLSPTRPGSQP